jgi:hypothetical protein
MQACRLEVKCEHVLGLDCDIARLIFAFGLKIMSLEMCVDGSFLFMAYMVCPLEGHKASWHQIVQHATLIISKGASISDLLHRCNHNHMRKTTPKVHKVCIQMWDTPADVLHVADALNQSGLHVLRSQLVHAETGTASVNELSDTTTDSKGSPGLEATLYMQDTCGLLADGAVALELVALQRSPTASHSFCPNCVSISNDGSAAAAAAVLADGSPASLTVASACAELPWSCLCKESAPQGALLRAPCPPSFFRRVGHGTLFMECTWIAASSCKAC